jgi:two-component system, cell cycle sensor histidine kinase and response regulator CckA
MSGASILLWSCGLVVGLGAGLWLGWRWHRRRMGATPAEDVAALRSQLQRAQRMEALGILSGSIMHSLNNLLSVVLGQARLARDVVPAQSEAWQSLGQVIQAGEAAAELSREIDSYQREVDLDRHPTQLGPVVRATVKLLRDILPDTVKIETELDRGCGPVLASPTQVQQVLMSLCSNAYHAMFRRRGRITITLAECEVDAVRQAVPRELAPGRYVKLSVADNGRGMDAETLQRVFEPYFSARAPRRGAGLGLTMVSRLLAANEGVTIPSSLPGHGTRFDLYFPVIARELRAAPVRPGWRTVAPTDTADRALPYEAPAVASRQSVARSAHILVLEDNEMVADTVRTCLERAGLRVTSFLDGAEALAAFAADAGAFDLLLTDQFLRGLDGREVIAEVRRSRPRMPIILMSGHPEGILAEEVQRLGVNDALAKPFTPSQLIAAVKANLRPEQKAREEGA